MAKTFIRNYPITKNGSDVRDGLKRDNTRSPRSNVRNKINQIDFDLEDLEWIGDDDLPIFEKM